ncbi:MAG TPA: winged helix-turn-helix transcriptional regulator [Thermoleophilaceae bacterium]|nr:winged helix-turn-helix transcriptional regulator [Thermoleophilaceae bacterium]
MVSRRTYPEYCAIARSLDLLGQRWTLLVVRDLFLGPQRYTDLQAGLPGIASDILTARLRALEDEGLVRRRDLPPPAPATVYELTEAGRRLGPLIRALGEVGLTLLDTPAPGQPVNPGPVVMSLNLVFRADQAGGVKETYGLELDGHAFTVQVDGDTVTTERGAPASPAATFRTAPRTLVGLLRGETTTAAAEARGDLEVEGDRAALDRFTALFLG